MSVAGAFWPCDAKPRDSWSWHEVYCSLMSWVRRACISLGGSSTVVFNGMLSSCSLFSTYVITILVNS